MVHLFLTAGINPNAKMKDGQPVLVWAVQFCDKEVIKALLDKGADVNDDSYLRETPLIFVLKRGDYPEIVKLLLDYGEDVNGTDREGSSPLNLISYSRRNEIIKLLIEKGGNVNFFGKDKSPPLLGLIEANNLEGVKLLLDHGADVNGCIGGKERLTPPMAAVRHRGRGAIVRALWERGAKPNIRDSMGRTPLMEAASHGDLQTVEAFLDKGADLHAWDDQGNTALMEVARKNKLSLTKLLLGKGAVADGKTALVAACAGHVEILKFYWRAEALVPWEGKMLRRPSSARRLMAMSLWSGSCWREGFRSILEIKKDAPHCFSDV